MLIVVAVGGNALLRRGERLDAEVQRRNVARAADAIAEVANDHAVVLTHGNGPQIGLLALQSEAYHAGAHADTTPYPIDVLGAQTEGMIGYLLEQELGRRLGEDAVATMLTQVVVEAADEAFAHPTKPVGPVFDREQGAELAAQRGWAVVADGEGVRRALPSPEPKEIVEVRAIRTLCAAGLVVICAGGGGIPVVRLADGGLVGVEAVIDKDRSAALLATEVGAEALLLLTDVEAVYVDFGTPAAAPVRRGGTDALAALALPAGSMGPKVEAACRFAESGGIAAIGRLEDAAAVLAGAAGTRVVAGEGRDVCELADPA